MARVQHDAPASPEAMILKTVCIVIRFVVALISTTPVFVGGLPILGPDLNSCQPVFPNFGPASLEAIDCCLVDTSRPIKDFKFDSDMPVRVRRPAHKLDDEFVRKYERGVELMKALPPEDPRSFSAQSRIHCTYCAAAYNKFNFSVLLNVHMSWFVLPFHRWYLYFHERILASLIDDPTFAMPYWPWDVQNEYNPPANTIPPIYVNKGSPLYDEKRSKFHQPPMRVDFQTPSAIGNRDPDVVLQDNYYNLWRTMIGQVQTSEAFYGGKISLEDDYIMRPGVVEMGPHAAVHDWTGDAEDPNGEDMFPAYSAARDPVFFAHHSPIDRLWWMRKSWGGKDFDDLDWLDTEFLFYDENADLVRVTVRDTLNFDNFKISYEQEDPDWLDYTPKSIRDIDPNYAQAIIPRRFWSEIVSGGIYRNVVKAIGSVFQRETNEAVVGLGGGMRDPVTTKVSRTEVLGSTQDSSVHDEVLVISGFATKPPIMSIVINIFLELPEADENTPQHCAEFLGGVFVDAEGRRDRTKLTVSRKFIKTVGIRQTLQVLDITRHKSLEITFLPTGDPKHDADISVTVTGLNLEMRRSR